MKEIIGCSAGYGSPSRTRALVTAAAERIGAHSLLSVAVFDLDDLGPSLGVARRLDDFAPEARDQVEG